MPPTNRYGLPAGGFTDPGRDAAGYTVRDSQLVHVVGAECPQCAAAAFGLGNDKTDDGTGAFSRSIFDKSHEFYGLVLARIQSAFGRDENQSLQRRGRRVR